MLLLVEKDQTGSRGRLKVSRSAAPLSLWLEPQHWIKYQDGSRHNGEESAKGGKRLDCYSKRSWPRQIKRFSPGGRKAQRDGEGAMCLLKIGVFFFFHFVEKRRIFFLIKKMKRKLVQFQQLHRKTNSWRKLRGLEFEF